MNDLIPLDHHQIRINELITTFILAQDVKPSSKRQYEGSLRQYFSWIDQKQYNTLTAHILRHTCAVNILRAGGSLQDAQNVLRHLSVTTTQLYISSLNESSRLEKPAEQLLDAVYQL